MHLKNLNASAFVAIAVCICSAAYAQDVARNIEINADHSLKARQYLERSASQRICIREGFKMAPGSSLKLIVIPNEVLLDHTGDKNLLTVYPNPGISQVTLSGSFDNSVLEVADDSGNITMRIVMTGTDPVIDISGLKRGRYVFMTSDRTTKFIKN